MSTFLALSAAATEGVHLPMPAWGFGVLAFVVFMALLLFLWTFRHTVTSGLRHTPHGHGDAGAHGHGAHGHGIHGDRVHDGVRDHGAHGHTTGRRGH